VRRGKTPVLTAEEATGLLRSIDTSSVVGLHEWALIAVMSIPSRACALRLAFGSRTTTRRAITVD
jgi:hypothetical protein